MQKKIKQAKKYLEWGKPNQAIAELKPTLSSKKIQKEFKWVPNHLMGIALSMQGDAEAAIRYLQKAVKYGSDQPETYHMLSETYFKLEKFEEAEEYGRKAVELKDSFLDAWMNLGQVYRSQAKLNKALECYQRANSIDPRHTGVAYNIGKIYRNQGDLDQAMKMFDITLQIDEDHLKAILEKADLLKENGRLDDALEKLTEARKKHSDHPAIVVSEAEVSRAQGDYDYAIQLYDEVIENFPENSPLLINYALCLQEVGRFEESEQYYREAIALADDPRNAISNYLMGLHYNPENSREYIFNEHIKYCKAFIPEDVRQPPKVEVVPDKKMKVGFISGGFRRHPVGWMIAGALEQLRDEDFELFCYTTDNRFDFITRRIHRNIDHWKSIIGYSDEVIKNIILDDDLDILVDLTGHAADNCMNVMAHKPASVLVKWVGGLFNTTGLEAFDYLITDQYESPKGEEQYYTEKLVRMPDDYITYTPPAYAPDVASLPAKENNCVTFGCFNNPTKVNEVVLKKWAKIMRQVPGSRLYLKSKQYDTASFREQILEVMAGEDIVKERIEFEGRTGHNEHLEAYNNLDIALDPWPYSGGLTTCEALYMGVPVITMPGPTFAGRHSTTHLMNAGLGQWVTDSWEEYTEKAVALATDLDELQNWRSALRQQLLDSPVCDGKRFGAHLSVAFREMWKQRVEGYQNNEEEWQDHITIDPLSDEQIHELTDGPDRTPLITIKDNEQTEADNTTDEKNSGHNTTEKSMIDSEELTQDVAQNGNVQFKENGATGLHSGLSDNGGGHYFLETKDGLTICAPADLDVLTTYVLLEQEEWFESELNFVRDYLRPGMRAVDVGAAFGAYALPMAKKVGGEGKVIAFELSVQSRSYLEKSKVENGMNQLEIIGRGLSDKTGKAALAQAQTPELNAITAEGDEEVFLTTLNAWWEFAGWPELDLVKVDVNGMEPKVLRGSIEVLKQTSPVILTSIGEEEDSLPVLRNTLNELNYRLFEYIPGPGVLAEHDPEAGVDSYMMNMVGIPESRVQEFKENGWIFDETAEVEAIDSHRWKQVLEKQPWATAKVAAWEEKVKGDNDKKYIEALNLACAAEQIEVSGEKPKSRSLKGALMLRAAQKLIALFNSGQAGIAAAMTYVRVMSQLGKRTQAVEMMKQLMETANSGDNISIGLPFLPPLPEQGATDIQTDFSKWLTVRIVEAWITLKDSTTYMSGEQELGMLEALEGNPERIKNLLKVPSLDTDNVVKEATFPVANNELPESWDKTVFDFLLKARPLEIKKHGLPSDLIISITSYPDRFDTLHLTLACLFNQTVMPDRLILWIAHEDKDELPQKVTDLQKYGLEIKFCEDIKSYKKIIPTLKNNSDAFITTADDDVYYWQTWLEELVKSWHTNKDCVIAHRVHRIKKKSENSLLPYSQWDLNYTKDLNPSGLNFPTGIGGVLYPPNVFHEDVLNKNKFMELCSHGDDIWLYWMYRMNGVKVKPTGKNRMLINWPDSQNGALWKENLRNGRNNEQIKNVISEYGFPNLNKKYNGWENDYFLVETYWGSYQMKLPDWQQDHIQRIIASNNRPYEFDMLVDMAEQVGEGDLFIDIGANIGNHSMFMANIAKCNVISIEPNSHLADAFSKSIKLNKLSRKIDLIEKGIGQEAGFATFEEEIPDNLGAQRLKKTDSNGQIEITTLDNLDIGNQLKLLKIDVEGMEMEVLKGGQKTIEKNLPVIYIEGKTEEELISIQGFLEPLGYRHEKTFNASPTHLFMANT